MSALCRLACLSRSFFAMIKELLLLLLSFVTEREEGWWCLLFVLIRLGLRKGAGLNA